MDKAKIASELVKLAKVISGFDTDEVLMEMMKRDMKVENAFVLKARSIARKFGLKPAGSGSGQTSMEAMFKDKNNHVTIVMDLKSKTFSVRVGDEKFGGGQMIRGLSDWDDVDRAIKQELYQTKVGSIRKSKQASKPKNLLKRPNVNADKILKEKFKNILRMFKNIRGDIKSYQKGEWDVYDLKQEIYRLVDELESLIEKNKMVVITMKDLMYQVDVEEERRREEIS